ncbi:hypothetical protein FF38_12697 [Lucilia cuprina]|uniref:Uncharacterized protein n=2 Tax=Lucilia cuprina TaxID=7375 RepID=A0A0L0C4E3_LUCCU|nr:hypothetical protein FF38_12697 [Lucilia cuprina]
MIQKHMYKYANTAKHMLNDKSLEFPIQQEIFNFKENINNLIENYNNDLTFIANIMSINDFVEVVEYYLNLTEKQLTPETKIIVEILKKYKCQELNDDYEMDLKIFIKDFENKFEANKMHLDEPLLEWYKHFKSLEDYEEQIMVFVLLLQMAFN